MKNEDIKIYCKFDKTKESIEKVIAKIFCDYLKNADLKYIIYQNGR